MKSDIARMYSEGLYRQHKYLATWLPSASVQLGDLGRLNDALWARESAVPSDVWGPGTRRGARIPVLEWQNTGKFTMETKAAGEISPSFTALARADGGIAYKFDKAGAVIFQANDLETEEVEDTARIRRWMLNEFRARRLDPNTLVVTRVLRAKTCVVLITDSDGARVEMKAAAMAAVSGRKAGALSGTLEIMRATGMFLHLVVDDGVPLFGGLRLRKGFWSGPRVDDALLSTDSDVPADQPVADDEDDPFELIGLA